MQTASTDDSLTLIALGITAFIIADVAHEALGHGMANVAVGGHYFSSSGNFSRWIPAGGGIANLILGGVFVLALRVFRPVTPTVRYFFILGVAFNLLFAFGYPFYSGVAAFGDWAAVISGLSPAWFWRALLVVVSVAGYYGTLLLLAAEMRPFCGSDSPETLARLRRITLIPFLAALVAACMAGALNPIGFKNVLIAAAPAAAAAFGLTQLDHFSGVRSSDPSISNAGPITRSMGWISVALVLLISFVALLGPGIKLG
jgi:hypothetical protein